MDIKGFKSSDGTIYKYDYKALANVPDHEGDTPDTDLSDLVNRAEAAATGAENAKSDAQNAATQAENSATLAGTKADDAETAASKAEAAAKRAEDAAANADTGSGSNVGYPDWSHLKWYVMGDSLTAKPEGSTEKRYYDFVQEKTGIQLIVDGIGATGYRNGEDRGESFLNRVQNIPEDVDIVSIFGSGNDVSSAEPEYANRAIYDTLVWIAFNRPGLRVIVAPPSPWYGYPKRNDPWKAYCDRLQVCALALDFRYLSDLWECPPFNPNFTGHMETFFTTDPAGVHPNEEGHRALAPYFYNALAQELEFDAGSGINGSGGNVDLTGVVRSVNGQTPDANGNVEIAVSGGTATAALPILYLLGDTTAMTKETRVDLRYTYVDSVKKEQRTGWCDCKWQGETSTAKPKKNYTIRFYNDPDHAKKDKIEYGGLTKASKWVTKANYVDQSHARNIVSARLWSDIVHSRSGELPTEMQESALNYGAIDGYPILIYLNGAYLGLYTMNIPKDEKLFGMDTDNPNHCALCGYANNNGDSSVVLSTQFRTVKTSDWENEVPEAWNDTNTAALTNLINFVKDSTDDDFVTNLNTYMDVESAIDYYIFMYFNGGIDSLGRNLVILTYDGVKWYCSGYDMDMTFGNNFNDTGVLSPETACPEGYRETNSLLWQRLEALFGNAIYNRYTALRQTVLSTEYVNRAFEMFISQIPKSEYEADYKAWPGMGQAGVDHLAQITAWVEARAEYVDEQMLAFTEEIPCESVVLSAESLTFIAKDAQTLTANVTPANTSDRVVWSTSDEDVATVSKGIVTPVGNGSCVITATCGNFSDECAVTVNAFTEETSELPDGYSSIEYIGTGTNTYFDTGVVPSLNTGAEYKIAVTTQGQNQVLSNGTCLFPRIDYSMNKINGAVGGDYFSRDESGSKYSFAYDVPYILAYDKNGVVNINGSKLMDYTPGSNMGTYTLLFNGNRNGTSGVPNNKGMIGKFYHMKLFDNDVLIHHYVPCTNPDGVVGMYDLVTATFHGSEGTAQFTAPA